MARRSRNKVFLLRALKLFGLDHLDPVILAALADRRPLLLIGPHGTAKSEMLNRLAAALGLEHRHYNAGLLSFDDLLGYPMPDPKTGRLEFIRTPASIWGAQSIFLDEISRCRPETANKLFSVIHEKRIQGIALTGLRYRWSAMNPPPGEDEFESDADHYLGSLPLDPALADRFAWVVEIPPIDDLPADARWEIISRGGEETEFGLDLKTLVEKTRRARRRLSTADRTWVIDWVDALIDPLREARLGISGRRAVMLRDSALWIDAACRALARRLPPADAAGLALRHALPQRAQGRKISAETLNAVHRLACSVAGKPKDSLWRAIRAERNPAHRILLALEAPEGAIDRSSLSQVVSDTLSGLPKDRRWILSLLVGRHPRARRLDAPTLELVARPMESIIAFTEEEEHTVVTPRSRAAQWDRVLEAIVRLERTGDDDHALLGNLLYTLFTVENEDFDAVELIEIFTQWRRIIEDRREEAAA